MTSTVSSLPTPTPVPPPSSSSNSNGISHLNSIASHPHSNSTSSGINSSERLDSYRHGNSNAIVNGGTGHKSHAPPPTFHEPDDEGSDSEAETVVLSTSRGRSRRNGSSRYPDHASNDGVDDNLLRGSLRRANRESKSRHDTNDADSSDLSSPPSSTAPSSTSRQASTKEHPRKRTASPGRLTTSPSRRKSQKLSEEDIERRRSLKRKARDASLHPDNKNEKMSPSRGIRKSSSPPMSPPPLPTVTNNGLRNVKDVSTSSATPASRLGHSRTRSVQSVGPSSKTLGQRTNKIKRARPAPLNFGDHSGDEKSSSSSRSASPHPTSRRRRTSFSGAAASPARLMPSHRPKRDKTGRTVFHKVCQKGDLVDVERVFDSEPDLLNDADNAGYLPIHAAALAGHAVIVRYLIDKGSYIDKPATDDLSTPLLDAVENMHVEVVDVLLANGADPRKRNKSGQASIDIASSVLRQPDIEPDELVKMKKIEESLKAASTKLRNKKQTDDDVRKTGGANESSSSRAASVASPGHLSPPPQSAIPLSSRRRTGRSETTRNEFLWLDAGKGGQAKLKEASRNGDIEMVGKLLESGIMPDAESVMLAARGGHAEVLNILLAFGGDSDPDAKDVIRQHQKEKSTTPLISGEETPLLATIGRGNIEILKLLLKSETMKDPRRIDARGRTYVDIAKERAGENWEDEVRLLQKAWDDSGPSKSKKSRDKSAQDISPALSRREKDRDKDRKEKLERRGDVNSDELKKTKRLRRRSTSQAPSSLMEDIATSERELSPVISRSTIAKDFDKQKRRDRDGKTIDSDYSAVSDNTAIMEATKKKRRLVLGKDLAARSAEKLSTEKVPADIDIEMTDAPKKKKKVKPVEDDEPEVDDVAKPKKFRPVDADRPIKREQSLDVPPKRNREASASSLNRTTLPDKESDADSHILLSKKRRKLEDETDNFLVKTKEERLAEREKRRSDASEKNKLGKSKSEKPPLVEISGRRETDELLERKKKKKREDSVATVESDIVKRSKDTVSSDREQKKSRLEREKRQSSNKDSMDIDTDEQSVKRLNRKTHDGRSDDRDEQPLKVKKRKSNGVSPAPHLAEEKQVSRQAVELHGGKSIRAAEREEKEVRAKIEPVDDDIMLTEEREKELEQERRDQERRNKEARLMEEKRILEQQLEQEKLLLRQKEEEEARLFLEKEQKRTEVLRMLERSLWQGHTRVLEVSIECCEVDSSIRRTSFEEALRIHSLPAVLREAALARNQAAFCRQLMNNVSHFLPLLVTDFSHLPTDVKDGDQWISNVQAVLLLGIAHDLEMTSYLSIEKRPVKDAEKCSLRNNLNTMYYAVSTPECLDFDAESEWVKQEKENAKFEAMENLFWFKISDFYNIIRSSTTYQALFDPYLRQGVLPTTQLYISA